MFTLIPVQRLTDWRPATVRDNLAGISWVSQQELAAESVQAIYPEYIQGKRLGRSWLREMLRAKHSAVTEITLPPQEPLASVSSEPSLAD